MVFWNMCDSRNLMRKKAVIFYSKSQALLMMTVAYGLCFVKW